MARFVVPAMPYQCGIWRNGTPYGVGAPSVTSNCQLAVGLINLFPGALGAVPTMKLLLPKNTDIRDATLGPLGLADFVEVPLGTGRWYLVVYTDDIGKGFPNEHRFAILTRSLNKSTGLNWSVPMA